MRRRGEGAGRPGRPRTLGVRGGQRQGREAAAVPVPLLAEVRDAAAEGSLGAGGRGREGRKERRLRPSLGDSSTVWRAQHTLPETRRPAHRRPELEGSERGQARGGGAPSGGSHFSTFSEGEPVRPLEEAAHPEVARVTHGP